MATLTQTAYIARQTIKYGSIGFVAFIILRASYITFRKWYIATHPKPPPPPNTAFGKLPKPKFPQKENLPVLNFKLDTISGGLPEMEKQGNVFFMPQPSVNFFALENTITWARLMGFIQEPQKNSFDLRFVNQNEKTTLDVNYLKRNFVFVYDWKNDLSITATGNPPDQNQVIIVAKAYLQKKGVLTEDLDQGSAEVVYLKSSGSDLLETNRFEANFAKANFLRKEIQSGTQKIKILPDNPKQSNVWLLISPNLIANDGVAEIHYQNFPISLQKPATYPFRDINEAWTQLLAGKGYIANLGNNSSGNIVVRKVYLAYYDSRQSQDYLQPIFVFEGDKDFFAYVPAITESWLVE